MLSTSQNAVKVHTPYVAHATCKGYVTRQERSLYCSSRTRVGTTIVFLGARFFFLVFFTTASGGCFFAKSRTSASYLPGIFGRLFSVVSELSEKTPPLLGYLSATLPFSEKKKTTVRKNDRTPLRELKTLFTDSLRKPPSCRFCGKNRREFFVSYPFLNTYYCTLFSSHAVPCVPCRGCRVCRVCRVPCAVLGTQTLGWRR